ncbi:hypothetical protein DXD29_09115 [Bifidobacterium pseudocatenulatum]|nr:hypothetical protein DXD29_09115 [Bifidobacterium pseudocatenulatum]
MTCRAGTGSSSRSHPGLCELRCERGLDWGRYSYWREAQGINWAGVLGQVIAGAFRNGDPREPVGIRGTDGEIKATRSWCVDRVQVDPAGNGCFPVLNGQHRLFLVHNCAFTKEQVELLEFDPARMCRFGGVYRLSPGVPPDDQLVPVIVRE